MLGLVSVPMFGTARAANLPGSHVVMLDGRAGSFAWSIGDPADGSRPAMERAWSSNVLWSVSLSQDTLNARVRRWDAPTEEQVWPIYKAGDAVKLFDFLRRITQPLGKTVIDRGLNTFKSVRAAIEHKGGSDLDVVLTFNTLLAFVSHSSVPLSDARSSTINLSSAVNSLHSIGALGFDADAISKPIRRFPIADLAQELVFGARDNEYLLDADLLVRHASGVLNQEAHKQLLTPSAERQVELFDNLIPSRDLARGQAPSYIHYTPPSLARVLVEVALRQIPATEDRPLSILDPACGSGVFLIETLRELSRFADMRPLDLRGFDKSRIAVEMTEFCLRSAMSSLSEERHKFSVSEHDSLALDDWGSPDVIVMNPPFLAWENLGTDEREIVRHALGPAHSGRPDMALAFIFRAIEAVRPGGSVASVVPSSFLESKSAEILRAHLSRSGQYDIRLIGQFRSFDYFDATVQPAFIVICRRQNKLPVRIVLADQEHEDDAVRLMRLLSDDQEKETNGCEVYNVQQNELAPVRWTPSRREDIAFVRSVKTNTLTTVGDFFIPRLGIRVGCKRVFMVSENELVALCPTAKEKQFFRPVADVIEDGMIQPSSFIFYPYSKRGDLLLKTESEVERTLPRFYQMRLRPEKSHLQSRRSLYRNWWEVSEPVATWLASRQPRIVSQEFGRSTNFAVDETGNFAVVQGFGWCWKRGKPELETLLAYLAIINSRIFDRLLSYFCSRVRGKQYVLRRHFVEKVPLPSLSDSHLKVLLTGVGRSVADTGRLNERESDAQEVLVRTAFGLSESLTPIDDPSNEYQRTASEFKSLADEWQRATKFYSFVDRKTSHPAYKRIVDMGERAIPHILLAMRDDPSYWTPALSTITGADPVPDDARDLDAVAAAWIEWGRQHGFDV